MAGRGYAVPTMGHNASAGLVRMAITAALLCLPSTSSGQQAAAPAADTSIRPFTINIPDAVLADLKTRLRNARFPEPLQGDGWALGTDIRYLKELVAYWRDTLRLARSGTAAERLRAVHDHHRRPDRPLHPSQVEGAERLPAADHARLARLVRGVHEDHRAAHRSGRARRPGRGRLRRRHPVDSRVHVLVAAARARLRPGTHRRDRGQADGAPRLCTLRRPGRRLGFDHQHPGGAARSGSRRRDCTSTCASAMRRPAPIPTKG